MRCRSLLHRRPALAAEYGSCHVFKWLVVISQSFNINLHAMLCESLAGTVGVLVLFETGDRDAGGG